VAPLCAGLFALINEVCGKSAGFIQPLLYGNPTAFRDIKSGDNKKGAIGYSAGPGWDACTGLGSPNGGALLKVFEAAAGAKASKPAVAGKASKPTVAARNVKEPAG